MLKQRHAEARRAYLEAAEIRAFGIDRATGLPLTPEEKIVAAIDQAAAHMRVTILEAAAAITGEDLSP